ncbi:hypothetical protein [Streptomyces sp. NPDC051219]|uniref:hypothetical protein n=1 Tax=Streptomyces sp. NPDC051219 TaxID=3155283 RepID=UPI0034221FFE
MPRRDPPPARCPASPLLVMGAILTIAGAVLYAMPAKRPELYAAAALVLGALAAWWCASRQG